MGGKSSSTQDPGVSVDVDWNVSITERPVRDIPEDLPGFPSLQEDAPSLKRGFLERKTSDLKICQWVLEVIEPRR